MKILNEIGFWIIKLLAGDELNRLHSELLGKGNELWMLKGQKSTVDSKLRTCKKEGNDLSIELNKLRNKNTTTLEKYCDKKYRSIPNKKYKDKRSYKGKSIDVTINQFITPDSFEVMNLRQKIKYGNTILQDALNIGNKVSKLFVWTKDTQISGKEDYYLYPEEIIVSKRGDCEDHAFTVSSLNNQIGVAYGFLNKTIGHAFNVFVEKNKLYILDTVGTKAEIYDDNNPDKYDIYFIVTKNKTYRVKSGVEFGEIAKWK